MAGERNERLGEWRKERADEDKEVTFIRLPSAMLQTFIYTQTHTANKKRFLAIQGVC